MDAHLETIPGVGTFSARRLTGGDTEDLGGATDGSLGLDVVLASLVKEVGGDCVCFFFFQSSFITVSNLQEK